MIDMLILIERDVHRQVQMKLDPQGRRMVGKERRGNQTNHLKGGTEPSNLGLVPTHSALRGNKQRRVPLLGLLNFHPFRYRYPNTHLANQKKQIQ